MAKICGEVNEVWGLKAKMFVTADCEWLHLRSLRAFEPRHELTPLVSSSMHESQLSSIYLHAFERSSDAALAVVTCRNYCLRIRHDMRPCMPPLQLP